MKKINSNYVIPLINLYVSNRTYFEDTKEKYHDAKINGNIYLFVPILPAKSLSVIVLRRWEYFEISDERDRLISIGDCRKNFCAEFITHSTGEEEGTNKIRAKQLAARRSGFIWAFNLHFSVVTRLPPFTRSCNADTWKRIRAIPASQTTFPAIRPGKWRRRRLLHRA